MPDAPSVRGKPTHIDERTFHGETYRFHRVEDIDLDVFCDNEDMMPYWADLWPSGEILARLLARTGSLKGVRMLELGCGLGLPSIVAASLGADVTACDYVPDALRLFETNAALNGVVAGTLEMDWMRPTDIGRFDLVVAADVLYENWQTDAVVNMLGRTVAPGGKAVVVDPDRLTAKLFMHGATYRGFRVVRRAETPVSVAAAGGPSRLGGDRTVSQPISVYDIDWREFSEEPRRRILQD